MKNTRVSISNYHPPVEPVREVSINIQRATERIMELQRNEVIAACNRFFPQGYAAAHNARLINMEELPEGLQFNNHRGEFICFLGNVETAFNFPDGYSRVHYTSNLEFKFRAFDGKTTRD